MQERDDKTADTKKHIKIAAIGDSITFGAHMEKDKAYPAVLQNLLQERFADKGISIEVANHGYGGETTIDGMRRLRGEVLSGNPDIAVVGYGMNDSVMTDVSQFRVAPDLFESTLANIVGILQEAGIITVLNTMTPVMPEYYYERHPKKYYEPYGGLLEVLKMYNAIIQRVGQATQCPVINITAVFNEDCDGIRRAGDGVHPDEQGHVLIAQAVFETIAQIIEANMSH